jgi:hypothetical protein
VDRRDTGFLLPCCAAVALLAKPTKRIEATARPATKYVLRLRTDFLRDASKCRFLHSKRSRRQRWTAGIGFIEKAIRLNRTHLMPRHDGLRPSNGVRG